MRVYLPATLRTLRHLLSAGELTAPMAGYAVTPALREWYAEGDLEELEYAALSAAARAALVLLGDDPGAPRRRVVLAADAGEGGVRPAPDRERASVDVRIPVRLADVAAIHVDEPAAEPVVARAAGSARAAAVGDADASFTVDEAAGFELQWWARQEIADLLEDPTADGPAQETGAAIRVTPKNPDV